MRTDSIDFLAPVRIDGADAAGFLHGQFTTDVADLASGSVTLSAWCDPKGKTIATFILARSDKCFWLLLPKVLREAFVKRLKMYVLRADVNIVDVSSKMACSGIIGAPGEETTAIFLGLETDRDQPVVRHNGYTLIAYPDNVTIVLAETEKISTLPTHLSGADSRACETAFIKRGIPWLQTETSGRFLPQELNLDTLDALSYTKGCYPGQEIIARLRYRGQVKRRLCYAITDNKILLKPGAGLIPTGEEKNIGTIVNSTATTTGQELLIVLEQSFVESGHIVAKDFPDWPVDVKRKFADY